ncbi:MAG: TonB-dependent receptor [Acidobacteria bacterium]|nr:TonB-dependent receptor [Acidobacteriota bacterium]
MACVLYGQGDLATVTGGVTDPEQAAMPDVKITIRNVGTNIARSMQTNHEGYFTLTNLPPGAYELTAEKEGFRSYRATGIVLETGQNLRRDVRLMVGSVTESVTVSAEVPPLNTENGTIKGDVIIQAEIQEIPLNGRDFTELAFLVPGVVPNAQGGAGSFASINGARGDNTNFYVDGFNDRNIRGAAAQLRPNMDALQEFKMEVSGYSAEYGKMAGGILNMVLRSGTNQFHGNLFEYFRNEVFDSRAYFDKEKLGFHQNQFGGTILGPLMIPKVYDGHNRTFFMFSWESYRLSWGETRVGNVPSALERKGDFTKTVNNAGVPITVRDPFASNAPFPGNVIPPDRFSPVALKLIGYYPLPNRTALGNNSLATAANVSDWDSFLIKADHRFNGNDSTSVRFGKRFARSNAPWAGSNLGIFQNRVRDDRELGGVDYTHMFSPTLLVEVRAGVSRNASRERIIGDGGDMAAELGMAGSTQDPLLRGFPLVNVTNYLSLGYANNQPVQYFVTEWQYGGKFTWVKAKHILKWGLDASRYQFNQPYFNNSRGSMTANGVWTGGGTAANGNAIGDLLLGLLNSASITTVINRNYLREQGYRFFVNDDWKVTRSLTLNLGLRYELETPAYDKYDRMSNFIPSLNKIIIASHRTISDYDQVVAGAGLTNLMGLAQDYGLPRSLVHTFYKGLAPRVGFAWRPMKSDRTVLRGGYGIFYGGQLLNDIRNGLDNTFPFVQAANYARLSSDPNVLTLASPWNPARATQTGTTTSTGYKHDASMGNLQSYNLTVERGIRGVALEVGYVGSKGTHLGRQYNINQPLRTTEWFLENGTSFPVPYPPLGTINFWDFGTNSIYNAGQITLRKRASGGFFYRLSYSFSKSIDDASQFTGTSTGGFAQALDPRNLRLERGRSDWDRGHVFTGSFAWPVPVGRGRRFLGGAGMMGNALLGGWQLSGTATFYSGPPFTVQDSTVNVSLGESSRPNRIASGMDVQGTGRRGIDYPWFAPSAFVHTPGCVSSPQRSCSPDQYGFLPFAPGNSGRGILDDPGRQNINLSLVKRFRAGERKSVQVRWETFNIFNHPNFLISGNFRNYNETAAGYLPSVVAAGQGGPRIMQFALRYEF